MKKAIIAGALVLGAITMHGQQLGQYSQYVQNPYIVNPAAAGMYDGTDINLSMRTQWQGLDNAPMTYYISGTTVLKLGGTPFHVAPILRTSEPMPISLPDMPTTGRMKHVVGGLIAMDQYGAFKKLTGMASYALHVPISDNYSISFGAGIGASNLNFDNTLITLENSSDQTYTNFLASRTSTTFLDLNLGLWLYSDDLFFGYSSNQLLQNKVYFGDTPTDARLRMHHYVTGGYRIHATEDFTITPSVMLKYMNPAPMSFDVTVKATYQSKFWAGVSYRHTDAIVAMLGAKLNNMFKLGYSYDVTTSNLNNYSSGSHEIVLGVIFN